MSKPKVYITRRVPVDGLELLKRKCEVQIWDDDEVIPRKTLLENVKGINGIFCLITETIDAELLDAAGMCLLMCKCKTLNMNKICCLKLIFIC